MSLSATINESIEALPAALRDGVRLWFADFAAGRKALHKEHVPALVKVVAISDFAARVVQREWPPSGERPDCLDMASQEVALASLADCVAGGGASVADMKATLRRERNRSMLGIFWRDALGECTVVETLAALSGLADQLLSIALDFAHQQLVERSGVIRDGNNEPVSMLLLGMGKLGGGELNFSSDVDYIPLYPGSGPGEGMSDGARSLHAQPYFDRLSRSLVELLDDVTEDGFVFRVDTRLRPFGDSGPPVISFAALESYLLQHGRDWERYAYVKARLVGRDVAQSVAHELFDELITPFVYRGYLDYGVFESLRDMHGLIASEGRKRELKDNIKLGPGGIREIEFIVQSLQLVRGSHRPELQSPSLLKVLPLLVEGRGLSESVAQELQDSYLFLRRLENFIQAMRDQQSHDLPRDERDRERLAFAMGYADWGSLERETGRVRACVSGHFAAIALREQPALAEESDVLPGRLEKLWASGAAVDEWQSALVIAGFEAADLIANSLVAFRDLPVTRTISTQAAERLQDFIPRLLLLARDSGQPDVAVSRCLAVVSNILRRSAYLALLNENSVAAKRLVSLCAQSAYVSAELAMYPVLLDELLDPGLVAGPFSRKTLSAELQSKLAQHENLDSEHKMELLARYQRATMFRIAVSDFTGKLEIMQVSDSLTFLAETILAEALSSAWDELVERHGKPVYTRDGRQHAAGLGVIAYGKLGGLELSYGSDLDIVFLHDSAGSDQHTDGERSLENSMFFSRLARRLVHFLTTRTNTGALYEVDTRLRPSGRKGLLVSSIEAFSRYQDENAWTWEHQALLRARLVAGSAQVAEDFARIRTRTLTGVQRTDKLRDEVLAMRQRMRAELDDSNSRQFNLKHGTGGIGDLEFLVQYLVLKVAASQPSVIEFTDNIRQLNALAECGALTLKEASELQRIYRHFRLRQHHLALNDSAPSVPESEFVSERARVVDIWQRIFAS